MKLVLDTNVLIGFFRNPASRQAFESRVSRPLYYMSSVVAMELRSGCQNTRQEKELASFLKSFEKAGRLIAPDHASFIESGRVLAKLAEDGIGIAHRRGMLNDILIAVSSTRHGAIVITANKHDFARIEKHTPLRWTLPT